MRFPVICKISLAVANTIFPMYAAQAQAGNPHELFGFLLRQSPSAFAVTLGEPFKEGPHGDGLTFQAFHIPSAKNSYLVAIFAKEKTNKFPLAVTLELTGTDYSGPTGFLGLKLGDDASSIEARLGKPTEIRHEQDADLDLWDYKQRNHSLEFTPSHKLYSIEINDENKTDPEKAADGTDARAYALAIDRHDIDDILKRSSGELECATTNSFGFREKSARKELADNSKLLNCLARASKAILALGPEMKGADAQIRLYEKGTMANVVKLPAASPLREVVFQWEEDSWRVYEVTFR